MKANEHANIPAAWRWHHQFLSRLRAALLRHRAECSSALRESTETGTDFSEIAADEAERQEVLRELGSDEVELAEVEAALERIRHGTYGVCEETGQPIGDARLRALPWTRFSVNAARRHETPRNP